MIPQISNTVNRLTLMAAAGLLVAACGEQPSEVEAKKETLRTKKQEVATLQGEIANLEYELAQLDTAYAEYLRNAVVVTTVEAQQQDFRHFVDVRGNVESRSNVTISAQTAGQVTSVKVREGDRVNRGAILAVQDVEPLRRQLDELQTQLELATTVFERQEKLWKQNIGTEVQYLQAKNNKESLENSIATLQSNLADAYVRAPFSGTIEEVYVRQGEMASPGVPVVSMVGSEERYIRSEVSEAFIGKFAAGDKATVEVPVLDTAFVTTIRAVGEVINQANRTFVVELEMPRGMKNMKPNLVTVVKLEDYAAKDAVTVPTKLLQQDKKGFYIFTATGSGEEMTATKQYVTVGSTYQSLTEIVDGLKPGTPLINQGYRQVNNGSTVRLADEDLALN